MGSRVLVAVAVAAIAAALLASAADRALDRDGAPDARPTRDARAASETPARVQNASGAASKAGRVPAGVLVRAASRRAHERATSAEGPERRRAAQEGEVLSIEIDWHANQSADR